MIEPLRYDVSMLGKDYRQQDCALARALEVVGERWTLLIVRDAFLGVRRFNDFQVHLDISKGVLAERLAGLTEEGILVRRQDPQHAGRSIYELTAAGRDLWPALHALLMWGDRHRYPNSRLFRHAACGTTLDQRAYCATCQLAPEPEDIATEFAPGRRAARDDAVTFALSEPHRLLEPVGT